MAGGKTVAAQCHAWLVFEDEAGQPLRPPKARTWGKRGRTPVIPVPGKGSGRISIAGLSCYRPGERSRLIYRTLVHRGRDLMPSRRRNGAPVADRLNAFAQLIRAVTWLHARGVVANDVHTENTLCSVDGSAVCLVDCDSMWAPASVSSSSRSVRPDGRS